MLLLTALLRKPKAKNSKVSTGTIPVWNGKIIPKAVGGGRGSSFCRWQKASQFANCAVEVPLEIQHA